MLISSVYVICNCSFRCNRCGFIDFNKVLCVVNGNFYATNFYIGRIVIFYFL